ncbi:MAG: PAS domain S-box protein [bacterium]|nr:PAS domain S-box protein [bacterium]
MMKALRWATLWGSHLAGSSIPQVMVLAVGILAVGPSIAGLLEVDFGLDQLVLVEKVATALSIPPLVVQHFAHSLLEWTAAGLILIVAIFALGRSRTADHPEAWILAAALPAVALLDGMLVLSAWTPVPEGADPEEVSVFLWTASRTFLAVSLLLGAWLSTFLQSSICPPSGEPSRKSARWILALSACGWLVLGAAVVAVSATGAPRMLYPAQVVPRPWDLLPLLVFAISGLYVFPRLHRARPSILNHALIVSTVPQIIAQFEVAFGSLYLYDSHFVLAHFDKLLAYATILSGILFDYVHTQRSREDAMHGFESAQLELRKQTQELERVDRERVDQDLKRRRAERSLRILEKAVETMSLGVTVSDLDGKILYVNPADARMHGYTVEELLGRSARRFAPGGELPGDEFAGPDSDVAYLKPWSRERINVTRGGREFPVRLVSDIVRDHREAPLALVTICEDITDERRIAEALARRDRILEAVGIAAERFLAESSWEASVEEVLETLQRATGVGHIYLRRVHDPATVPRGVADTWSALNGISETVVKAAIKLPGGENLFPRWEEELRQGRLLQGKVPDLPDEERAVLEARGVRSYAVVPIFVSSAWLGFLCLEDSEDQRDWSLAELEVLRTAARTFGAAIQRKLAEEALAASQARYQDLLENASDLVQSVSPKGRFQFVNRAWKEALGYTQEEVSGITLWDVVHPTHHDRYKETIRRIMSAGGEDRLEVAFVTKQGTEITVEGSINCRFVDGEPVATRGIFRDITERKIVDRMKQEFISTVSHELRTPLTSIIAALGLLESGRLASDPDRVAELVTVAHRNSNRLLRLINNLLDLQKLAAGKTSFRIASIDARNLLEEAIRGIRSFADSLEIRLEIVEVTPGVRILADRDHLIQVLNNLLSNAIKFSPKGAEVILTAYRQGERAIVSVADCGPGIPEEFQQRLFEKFTQVDSSPTRTSGGSGLGLSIVKGLVDGMGGRISVETRLGRGTTFHVELPMASPSETAATAEAAGTPNNRRSSNRRPRSSN